MHPTADPAPLEDLPLPGFPPPPRYRFQGRARELLDLERALRGAPAVLLHAAGGRGKTALAREAAHWWRRTGRFTHACFHSFEQGAGAEAVVRLLGESLGGADFAALPPAAQWDAAVRLYRRHRVLLVWDNYESMLPAFATGPGPDPSPIGAGTGPRDEGARADLERLFRELTEGEAVMRHGGRLLITCRPGETGLPGVQELHLGGLERPDALHLLRRIVDQRGIDLERPGWERDAIDDLLERVEDHPLSIELIAPHLKDLPPRTIARQLAERLAEFQDQTRPEGRNRSLLASLDFSLRHLSEGAREALPWLGWFEGGMFEAFFLSFSGIPEDRWSAIRAELTATALLRVQDPGFQVNNRPYLKLHPTLAESAAPATGDGERAGSFIGCYLQVMRMIDGALRGAQPAAGMALMRLEERNLRRALGLAFALGRHRDGWALADTLGVYLQMSGRLRERDRLTAWVRERMPEDRLDAAACDAIRQHAWSLFTQGQAQAALEAVLDLEQRLTGGGLAEGDAGFQLAMTRHYRGRILLHAGRPDLALEPLGQAIEGWRALGDGQRGNLSMSLGDLANALNALGRSDQALASAEEALEIDRALGRDREVATGLGQTAAILMDAGRHAEAEARYREALETAERVGDLGLQGALLQHLGVLQGQTGRTADAIDTLRRALRSFQQSSDQGNEMRTCDLLGSAEQGLGRLDPAEAWYRKALDLARALGDQGQIGATRQNLGVLYQRRALSLPDGPAAAPERDRHLAAAVTECEASLAIKQGMDNRLGAAYSHFQLATLHRLRGDLDRAESEARQSLAIVEPLDQPDLWKDYANLAEIARARGDTPAAADWQARSDAKREEAERRGAGPAPGAGGPAGALDPRLLDALLALARSVHQARTQHRAPDPETAEALAALAGHPAPLGDLGRHLAALARGEDPPPPPGLPEPLAQLIDALHQALAAGTP